MESKTCRHVTLRLLYSDPEHMRILGILDLLATFVVIGFYAIAFLSIGM